MVCYTSKCIDFLVAIIVTINICSGLRYLLVTPTHINSSCAAEFICCCTKKHFHSRATNYWGCRYHPSPDWSFQRHSCLKWKSGSVSFIKARYKHTYCLSCEWTPLITHMNTVHRVQALWCTFNTLILSLVCFVLSFSEVYSTNILTSSSANSSIHEGKARVSGAARATFFIPIASVQLIIWTPLHT